MATRAFDNFDRPAGALGTAPTFQRWAFWNHTTTAGGPRIANGRGVFPVTRPGTFATLDTGLGGGDATVWVELDPTQYAQGYASLYFRVVDGRNFWRLTDEYYSSTDRAIVGYTDPTYAWVGTGTYYYEPAGAFQFLYSQSLPSTDPNFNRVAEEYTNYDARVDAYLNRRDYHDNRVWVFQNRQVIENQEYRQTGGEEPIYEVRSQFFHRLRLQRFVNGAVFNAYTGEARTATFSSMKVRLTGNNIEIFDDKDDTTPISTYVDPTHRTATKHGFGYGDITTSGYSSPGIGAFDATPRVERPYLPRIML